MSHSDEPTMIVFTPTLEEYIDVVKWSIGDGKYWCNGEKTINEWFWRNYENEMCIIFRNDTLSYSSLFFAKLNYKTEIYNTHTFYMEVMCSKYLGKRYNLR